LSFLNSVLRMLSNEKLTIILRDISNSNMGMRYIFRTCQFMIGGNNPVYETIHFFGSFLGQTDSTSQVISGKKEFLVTGIHSLRVISPVNFAFTFLKRMVIYFSPRQNNTIKTGHLLKNSVSSNACAASEVVSTI